jgi:hypothetical protein
MSHQASIAWRGGGKAVVAACIAAVIAAYPVTVPAATASWAIVQSPIPSTPGSYLLRALACIGASDCWAVGSGSGGTPGGFIEHYDGSSWVIATSPTPANSVSGELFDVTCVSASDCWAVGDYSILQGLATLMESLIEHYDGSKWSIVGSPNPNSDFTYVSCASPSNCWASGYDYSNQKRYVEHYDGTSWAVQPGLFVGAITCLSARDCWGVGSYSPPACTTGPYCTSIEHFDGSRWVIVPTPKLTRFPTRLTCISASDCWGVGAYLVGNRYQTSTAHYDGHNWTLIPSPNVGGGDSALIGVSCASTIDCWAVGYHGFGGSRPYRTLVEHNVGKGWVIVQSPNLATQFNNVLLGVKCFKTHACWAVGGGLISNEYTLVEYHG